MVPSDLDVFVVGRSVIEAVLVCSPGVEGGTEEECVVSSVPVMDVSPGLLCVLSWPVEVGDDPNLVSVLCDSVRSLVVRSVVAAVVSSPRLVDSTVMVVVLSSEPVSETVDKGGLGVLLPLEVP